MDIIKSSIKCFHCNKTLEKPVLLPCGKSVCQHHTTTEGLTEFSCVGCGSKHVVPLGGFWPNNSLEDIIKTQIDKLNLGNEHDEALSSCRRLEEILSEIGLLTTDPRFFINEAVNEIRTDVQLKREKLKLKIDNEADRIIRELDAYEEDCKTSWSTSNFREKLKNIQALSENTQVWLVNWKSEFDTLNLDASKWKSIKDNSERIIGQLELELGVLKQELMLNRLKDFRIKPIEFNELDINCKRMRSKILSIQLKVDLMNLCKFPIETEWVLLYRGNEDGFQANKFHAKCDQKPNTLTIIKTVGGFIFGGYTEMSWDMSNAYKTDPNAFLFSLVNRDNKPCRINILPGKESFAIYGTSVSGPRFGGGSDLIVADNANSNTNSFTNLGNTFQHPVYPPGSNEAKCALAGSYNFQLAEIEVYQKLN